MLLLFTSADSKHPLYKRDLLNLSCEPLDAQMQFSYRKKWIGDNVPDAGSLKEQTVLVVLCERLGTTPPFYLYHPTRVGTVVDTYDEFGSINISFRLGGFFNYDKYLDTKTPMINAFQDYVKQGMYPGEQPYKWLRMEAELVEQSEEQWVPSRSDFTSHAWQPLVRHLATLNDLNTCTFWSVQSRNTFGGPPKFLFQGKPTYDSGRATYSLKGGKSQKIILYIIAGKSTEYKTPELVVGNSVASVSGPFLRQRSSDIEADFELFPKRSFQLDMGMLELRVPREQGNPENVRSPEIQALIKVGVPWGLLLVTVLLLTIGAIAAVISPGAIDEFAAMLRDDWHEWIKTNKILIFTMTKVIAFLSLGAGTFFGFNKLPFKA
jgi:hypothetical protein